jgi:RimJ/RimL family protein N-acetyltransferase
MKKYMLKDGEIEITNEFPDGHMDEFLLGANDSEMGFRLMTHSFPYPYTEEDAVAFINKNRESGNEIFEIDFYIMYGKRFTGVIGLSDIDYENSRAHIGYWVARDYRNKGIGGKALGLTVQFAREQLKLNSLYTTVLTSNIPSIIILTENGFAMDGISRDRFKYEDKFYSAFIFSLLL